MADGRQVSLSPSGAHVAAVEGTVHWAIGDVPGPRFLVDDKVVSNANATHRQFLSKPEWAPDGNSLAIVTKDPGSDHSAVLVHQIGGITRLISMGEATGVNPELTWNSDGSLYLILDGVSLASPAKAYWVQLYAGKLSSVDAGSVPDLQAAAFKQQVAQELRASGLHDLDIWIAGSGASSNTTRFYSQSTP